MQVWQQRSSRATSLVSKDLLWPGHRLTSLILSSRRLRKAISMRSQQGGTQLLYFMKALLKCKEWPPKKLLTSFASSLAVEKRTSWSRQSQLRLVSSSLQDSPWMSQLLIMALLFYRHKNSCIRHSTTFRTAKMGSKTQGIGAVRYATWNIAGAQCELPLKKKDDLRLRK